MHIAKNILKKIDKFFFNKYFQDIISRNTFGNFKLNKNNLKDIQRWIFFFEHIKKNKISGNIVECGVGNGVSLSIICYLKNYYEMESIKIYACDSFKGFPKPKKLDFFKRKHNKGDWSHTNIEYVKRNLKSFGIDDKTINEIRFIPGYFDTTLKNLNTNKICILHLDCDLYDSYKTCFKELKQNISEGGIIVLDEYFEDNTNNPFPGAIIATNEYIKENNASLLYKNNKGYIIN
ncbi:TylF/MycF/NovP-related O-methyltransferase [Candidatus Pelagibacter sp. HIMB1517]|uniref:TylF/MycF/NovP-related O-methyltransferase n=1 Tax=Candidatus Pelagibacter sp. HIMB1517 TaxID=3413341 RepID=UPI003F8266E0